MIIELPKPFNGRNVHNAFSQEVVSQMNARIEFRLMKNGLEATFPPRPAHSPATQGAEGGGALAA